MADLIPGATPNMRVVGPLQYTNVPVVEQKYANVCQVDISDSDITLKFGVAISAGQPPMITAAVTLTHGTAIKVLAALQDTTDIIKELYGGSVPSFGEITPEKLTQAKAKIASRRANGNQ
ncbi:MAG: DUF3467 domain-containing protein [Capsulimonadaceae bacterium]|nr:DUF3467 domain-containing protein [Capsulimonadaceae bacterium]